MTGAVFVPWKNPLAELVRRPGGVKIGQALASAAENLETIRDSCLEAVDARLSELEQLCSPAAPPQDDQARMAIYHAANDICGVAGAFGLAELGEAAMCLCELVDRLRWVGKWSPEAVAVHLSALKLLRRANDGTDRSEVVRGLRRLVDRVAVTS